VALRTAGKQIGQHMTTVGMIGRFDLWTTRQCQKCRINIRFSEGHGLMGYDTVHSGRT